MRKISLLFAVTLLSWMGLNAQAIQGEKSVTHFYIVNLDENLFDVFSSGMVDSKTTKSIDNEVVDEFIAGVIDTFYTIAAEKFKEDIGLELLPLNELNNKIKYNKKYPNCPDMDNIKKVLKNVSGYKYYMDYFVNIFSDANTDFSAKPTPNRIKPLFAISFNLYDGTGKLIEKIDYSYKSNKSLSEGSKPGIRPKSQQMKVRLCNSYSDALNGFSIVCKRKLTAQL